MSPPDWCVPGRRVVCVRSFPLMELMPHHLPEVPRVDGVYTIRSVEHHGEMDGLLLVGLLLEELHNPPCPFTVDGGELDFGHTHFRPVRETSIESLRGLLSPSPETTRELSEETLA